MAASSNGITGDHAHPESYHFPAAFGLGCLFVLVTLSLVACGWLGGRKKRSQVSASGPGRDALLMATRQDLKGYVTASKHAERTAYTPREEEWEQFKPTAILSGDVINIALPAILVTPPSPPSSAGVTSIGSCGDLLVDDDDDEGDPGEDNYGNSETHSNKGNRLAGSGSYDLSSELSRDAKVCKDGGSSGGGESFGGGSGGGSVISVDVWPGAGQADSGSDCSPARSVRNGENYNKHGTANTDLISALHTTSACTEGTQHNHVVGLDGSFGKQCDSQNKMEAIDSSDKTNDENNEQTVTVDTTTSSVDTPATSLTRGRDIVSVSRASLPSNDITHRSTAHRPQAQQSANHLPDYTDVFPVAEIPMAEVPSASCQHLHCAATSNRFLSTHGRLTSSKPLSSPHRSYLPQQLLHAAPRPSLQRSNTHPHSQADTFARSGLSSQRLLAPHSCYSLGTTTHAQNARTLERLHPHARSDRQHHQIGQQRQHRQSADNDDSNTALSLKTCNDSSSRSSSVNLPCDPVTSTKTPSSSPVIKLNDDNLNNFFDDDDDDFDLQVCAPRRRLSSMEPGTKKSDFKFRRPTAKS